MRRQRLELRQAIGIATCVCLAALLVAELVIEARAGSLVAQAALLAMAVLLAFAIGDRVIAWLESQQPTKASKGR
jgi:hypothetical protein